MSDEYDFSSSGFQSLKTVSQKLFRLISKQLNVNTTYVTQRGETAMTVVSSYNKNEVIIKENYSVEYGGTYCRLILMSDGDAMHTENLTKDALTRELEVTEQLEVKGFLGVALKDLEGNIFGTLCAMDKEEKNFTEEDISFLKSIASILSHIIELDQTKFNMGFLSVPIIPIAQGISIFPIQGIVDESRAAKVMSDVLNFGADNQVDYFIIDLSKLAYLDTMVLTMLHNIVKSLKVMGIESIITGISPEFAKQEVNNSQFMKLNVKTVKDINAALNHIGYTLSNK